MKEINLLEEHIAKLEGKDFDFKAWKQYSIFLLSRIFGDEDQKVKHIARLEMDYSSWSLRDTSGKSSQVDALKKLGKEILLSAIDELKSLGVTPKNNSTESVIDFQVIISALESELKIFQLKELLTLINSELTSESKKTEIAKKLAGYGDRSSINILSTILSDNNLKKKL